jgi:tetratricopeptide (TPR) repeat protein
VTTRTDHLAAFQSWDVLANLPAEKRRAILHMLACEPCRAAVLGRVAPPPPGEAEAPRRCLPGQPAGRARSEPARSPHAGSWTHAGSMRARPSLWARSCVAMSCFATLRRSRRWRGRLRALLVAEGLLAAAERRLADEPRQAEQLAHVAFRLAVRADPRACGRSRLVEVRVARWSIAAAARLLLGDDAAADEALRHAFDELSDDADPATRARYCRSLAGFRLAQRRHDEALGLLLHAAQLYDDAGEEQRQASTHLDRACVLAEVAESEKAIAVFHLALRGLDAEREAALCIRAYQGIAACYAELQLGAEAAAALASGRALYSRLADTRQRLQAVWREARVLAGADDPVRAAALLAAVVEDLMALRDLRRAVVAALQLAAVYADYGERESLAAIAGRIVDLLPASGLRGTGRQAVLFALKCSALDPGRRGEVLVRVAGYLERSRHRPGLPFTPTAAPGGTVEWEALSRAERQRVRARAGFPKASLAKLEAELTLAERNAISWPYEVVGGVRIVFGASTGSDTGHGAPARPAP